eukprot:149778_1
MTSPSKRRDMDVMKLMMTDYEVTMEGESACELYVKFEGPRETPYEDGMWKVHVVIPVEYPYKSPSIGFCNKIFHPNIDLRSGTVCLDVINQTWSPMYDLVNIFSVFLPQLLAYPNAADPLNSEAASLFLKDKGKYCRKVRELVEKFASSSDVISNASSGVSNQRSVPISQPNSNRQAQCEKKNGLEPDSESEGSDMSEMDDDMSYSSVDDDMDGANFGFDPESVSSTAAGSTSPIMSA